MHFSNSLNKNKSCYLELEYYEQHEQRSLKFHIEFFCGFAMAIWGLLKWLTKKKQPGRYRPPPLLELYFSPGEIYYNEGVRAAGEKLSAFFCNFVYFKSNW